MKVCIAKDGKIRVLVTDRGQNLEKLPAVIGDIVSGEAVAKMLSKSKVTTFWINDDAVFALMGIHSPPGWEYGLVSVGDIFPK